MMAEYADELMAVASAAQSRIESERTRALRPQSIAGRLSDALWQAANRGQLSVLIVREDAPAMGAAFTLPASTENQLRNRVERAAAIVDVNLIVEPAPAGGGVRVRVA